MFNKNKENILKFAKSRPEFLDVVPIKTVIPKWFKDTPPKVYDPDPWRRNTGKSCVPFLDSLTTGYTILLPIDLMVTKGPRGETVFAQYDKEIHVITERDPKHMPLLPIPKEYSPSHFIWTTPVSLEAPSGYSLLITHPLNRFDLPFFTLSGIVDDFKMSSGALPVLFKKDFEGHLPAGTPIAQIIPFKREDWLVKETPELHEESLVWVRKSRNVLSGHYKKTFWKKKNYN
jgi:hypothetical protein